MLVPVWTYLNSNPIKMEPRGHEVRSSFTYASVRTIIMTPKLQKIQVTHFYKGYFSSDSVSNEQSPSPTMSLITEQLI